MGMDTMSDSLTAMTGGALNRLISRMGNAAQRILEIVNESEASEGNMTSEDLKEISFLGDSIYEIIQLTIRGFTTRTKTISPQMLVMSGAADRLLRHGR